MKITLVISSLGPGGAESVMSELANYLVAKGNFVTIVTLSAPTQKPFYTLNSKIILKQINMKSKNKTKLLQRIVNILLRCYKLIVKAIMNSMPNVVLSFIDIMNHNNLIGNEGNQNTYNCI